MPKKQYPQKKRQQVHYQEPVDPRTAQELLADQLLLLKIIHEKLSALMQIKQGHIQQQFAEGSFMPYLADVLYKGLIIDMGALFGGDRKTDTTSLQLFYTDIYTSTIEEEKLNAIRSALSKFKPAKNPVKRLVNLRNKEVSHYDATASENARVTIRLNWEFVDTLQVLFKAAEKVLKIGLELPEDTFAATPNTSTELADIIISLSTNKG